MKSIMKIMEMFFLADFVKKNEMKGDPFIGFIDDTVSVIMFGKMSN